MSAEGIRLAAEGAAHEITIAFRGAIQEVSILADQLAKEQPTLRDRFAMVALDSVYDPDHGDFHDDARNAYKLADAMLAAREHQGE